jgi:protein-S-isoprenylcysteine O-methyltransferase Ste14
MAADTTKPVGDNPGVIAPPPAIALATVLLGLALDWLIPVYVLTVVFYFWTRVVIGVLLIAAGAALAVTGERSFRAAQTNVAPWRPALRLVTSGIFARVRNPMYLGLGLIVLGLGFALASDWTLVLLVPAALLLHYGVVRREERYLEDKFGEDYRRYKASAPRYGWPGLT